MENGLIYFPCYIQWTFALHSGSLGITKLLKVGPCRLVRNDTVGFGFFLLVLSNLACIHGKVLLLFTTLYTSDVYGEENLTYFTNVITIWIILSTIPHLFFVSCIFFFNFHISSKTLKLSFSYGHFLLCGVQ